MPCCNICLSTKSPLKFATGRLSICKRCVETLNATNLSPRQAGIDEKARFLEALFRRHADASSWANSWVDERFDEILSKRLREAHWVSRSEALQVLRAHRRELVCLNRDRLSYPSAKAWNFKRFKIKHLHQYACYSCSRRDSPSAGLHAHHIVHRSNSGTNSYKNLVALCIDCHQEQHPGFRIGIDGGEPAKFGTTKPAAESWNADDANGHAPQRIMLPHDFDPTVFAEVRPAFSAELKVCRLGGGTMKDLFVLLIQKFGSSVGRYALTFAHDERLRAEGRL